jgi:tetratricopeptide (TPR) repeat protein
MIKFFRKIRQKLLTENKFSKYLLYAIGEIVLVMVGILLALQVNNWNELRKKEEAEIQLYHKIIADLNSEQAVIENKIRDLNAHQNIHFQIYFESQGKAEYNPTINYKSLYNYSLVQLFFDENYSKSLPLINDNETHNLLKKYIDQEKITTTSNIQWNEIKTEHLKPFLAKHGIKNTEAVFEIQSPDDWAAVSYSQLISYPKLIEQYGTIEFNQLLYELRVYTTWLLHNFNLLKKSNREFEMFLKNKLGSEQTSSEQRLYPILLELLLEDKTVDEIIEIVRNENPEDPIYHISEAALNNLGYNLIDDGQLNAAKKIFELGIELYPNDYNLYDSYGECLFMLKEYENSTKAFKKALELNPESVNSKRMLEQLKTKG